MSSESLPADKILKLLTSPMSHFVSGSDIASRLGISRTMVWKHIKMLKNEGFVIEASPSRGYRIAEVPDILRMSWIAEGLRTNTIGREIKLFTQLPSTNTHAMELAALGAVEGTVVIAETQTQGKGRLGRNWISPHGNLYFSVILRPPIPTHKAPLLTLMGAVAVAAAIRKNCNLPAVIKWPNDILLNGKKAAGLLTEMSAEPDRIRHIALGIGIDVNMPLEKLPIDLRPMVTTLAAEAGTQIDRTNIIQQVLSELDRCYAAFLSNQDTILTEWKDLNCTTGRRIAVRGATEIFEGEAEGIDREGRLIVRMDNGEKRIIAAGDVTILRKL